jgi:hypothetical protein
MRPDAGLRIPAEGQRLSVPRLKEEIDSVPVQFPANPQTNSREA